MSPDDVSSDDEFSDDEFSDDEFSDDEFSDDEVVASAVADDDADLEIAPEGNRAAGGRARSVVEHIARHIVDDPDGIMVEANERGNDVILLVHASPGDMGRLIGKRGRVIQAIRQVGRAAGSLEGVRVTVDIAE